MLASCDSTRLRPCCRIKPGYGGFDQHKTIRLKVDKIENIAKYETEFYLILLDKRTVIQSLKNKITDTIDYEKTLSNTKDTLDINGFKFEYRWHISKVLAKHLDRGKVIIIEKATGQRLFKIKRRKYNYQVDPKSGRGGIEYSDIKNNAVFFELTYWIS